ncbi:Rieske (2Fe-2S) protein [Sediminibacterium ginsengisoli]|uniref:3-phenylpropionate/trans-cinnamate dioxygenase ferredoxin subunit n=1 Tax=Sediminibacterium ginsengisoli TaxID=413434 RepID=A0A1T4MLQ3_9BACT|nr:Rieske 2Fe-2S domain-containing protein [Sediminibacterium ginsengisoli]SJZ67766.1 3-phenylpropionate/trans-cinnamate dioxygenase ferredoxin subunit [Sediminibacterium ginsengisoli]
MTGKKMNWHKVADTPQMLNWQDNRMCITEAGGKTLTLAQFQDQIYAFAHKCPHASGIMADGFIDATGQVVCPLHRYRFNMQNGRNTSGEGYYLKTYPVEQREDGLYIGFEEKGLFGF